MFVDCCWWKTLSRRKRKSVGKCEECGSRRRLSSHHVRYSENWFDTTFADLQVLCWPCHEKKHGDMSENGQPIPERAFVAPEPPKPVVRTERTECFQSSQGKTLPNNPVRPIYMTFFTMTELELARSRRQITKQQFKEGRRIFVALGGDVLSKTERKRISKQRQQRGRHTGVKKKWRIGKRRKRKKLKVGSSYQVLPTDGKTHYAFSRKRNWISRGTSSN
jgi:hypothetical protein